MYIHFPVSCHLTFSCSLYLLYFIVQPSQANVNLYGYHTAHCPSFPARDTGHSSPKQELKTQIPGNVARYSFVVASVVS